jgi:hypothetical protein
MPSLAINQWTKMLNNTVIITVRRMADLVVHSM